MQGVCGGHPPTRRLGDPGPSRPMRLSPPLPRLFRSAGGRGKRGSISRLPGAGPPTPRLLRRPPRPAGQTRASAVCSCKGCWEVRGSRSRRTRGWMGGPGGFRHLPALRRFSPGSSLPVGRGRGQLSRRVKARQRGVQPGSGARAGRAFPAAAVGECGPRQAGHGRVFPTGPEAAPGIIAVSVGGVGGGRSGWRGRPAADPTVGHSCPCDSQANPRPP